MGDERHIFLSTMPATRGDRRAALAVVGVSAVLFACAVPFAGVPLAPVPAFVASYQSALAINDLITAVLLFSQFAIARSRALLLLASGYLFTAMAAIVHALTFPGLFAPAGLFGAGTQTTVWLYMVWHGGFPLLVLGYALLKAGDNEPKVRGSTGAAVVASIVAVSVAMAAFTWLVTAQHDRLPILLSGGHYTPVMLAVVSTVWCLSFAALALLWLRRPHSVLDVWLMVVMSAWLFDIALSAILNVARFDVGFYLGRIYGLCAASFVLAILLVDNVGLQAKLARLLGTFRRRSRFRAKSPYRTREPLQRGRGIVQRRHHHQIARRHHHRLEQSRRTPVRLHGSGSDRQEHRHHRRAGPARRGTRYPRSGQPGRADRTLRDDAGAQGWPHRRRFAEHLPDPLGLRQDHRRLQDRARHHRKQTDGGSAQPGNRRAAAHIRIPRTT